MSEDIDKKILALYDPAIVGNAAFVVKAPYVSGSGLKSEFYKFDPAISTSSVQRVADIPATYTPRKYGFAVEGKGYILGCDGTKITPTKVFVFDPLADSWSQANNAPIDVAYAAEVNGKAYGITFYGKVYQYIPNK